MQNIKSDPSKKILDAVNSDDVVKIYTNGFTNGFNNADVIIVFEQNGKAKAVVNMSYTLAKTLAEKLSHMIKKLENLTGQEIMTTDYIEQKTMKPQPQLKKEEK